MARFTDEGRSDSNTAINAKLWAICQAEAKRKFKIHPSAFSNGYASKIYKKRGGKWRSDSLKEWFAEDWKAINSSGKIVGGCGDGATKGKVKCLPVSKARSLSKKDRSTLAKRKQAQDPNPDREGAPVMVSSKRGDAMTPEVFARAIVSIEQNYGLKLDARSVWLRMDDWKRLGRDQMGQKCGRGWVGLRGACKRVTKGGDKDAAIKASKVALADKIRARKGLSDRNALKPVVKKAENEPKSQQAIPQSTTSEAVNVRRTNGKHDDLADGARGQSSAIQKLTGMSADEAKASIKAIKSYISVGGDGAVSYGAIRNVQRGIFNAPDGKPHYGKPLTKSQIAKVQSSIESIDRYVKKMPAYEGVIHRGMSFNSDDARTDFLSKISKGYSLEAMSSFSSSRIAAEEFAAARTSSSRGVIFTVKNKSGASVAALSRMKKEEEVLVPKGTKYRIVGTPKKIGGVVVVQMEEI